MKSLKLNSSIDLKREGKSFYWASFFLPKNSKKNAGTLYSICRYFDDIADKNDMDQTMYLKDSINEIKNNDKNEVNIFLKKNNIHNSIFIDLLEGLILDQKNIEIQNRNELIKYSYHVAGTVGLMMAKIIGVQHKNAGRSAIDLGIGMQLTNIARDVFEDAQMQRIYIPAEWMPNLKLSQLNTKTKINIKQEADVSNAIHKVINLSEKFYRNGFSGLKYIPFKARLGIYIAANVYRGIGVKIKKKKKYYRERVYLNLFEKILITIKSILFFIFIPFFNYRYRNIRDSLPNENL